MNQPNEKLQKRLVTAREKLTKVAKRGSPSETRSARKRVKRLARKIASNRKDVKNASRSRPKAT